MYIVFEEFKKYHNANYHDGDSTFDYVNYAMNEGGTEDYPDFADNFVQSCWEHFEYAWKHSDSTSCTLSVDATPLAEKIDVEIKKLTELKTLKKGDKVKIVSLHNTENEYGANDFMEDMLGKEFVVRAFHYVGAVSLEGSAWVWHFADLEKVV